MSEKLDAAEPIPVRDRLLDAAEQVVAGAGVSNLTLDAVAREAGVSKGGLLYHFPSKATLITAIVERLATRCEGEQQHAMENDPRPGGGFTRAYLAVRATPPEPQEKSIHTALLTAAGSEPHYLEPIRAQFEKWRARLESDGIDPVTATIVRLAADGLALGDLLGLAVPTGELRLQVIDRLVAMTLPPECGEMQS
jgi:AcrR family transcriptional regulator